MFGAWHNWLFGFLCLLCTGTVVKLMDDFLDADYDLCRGRKTIASRLGRATLPYALVISLIGGYLDIKLALAVFLASYAVGMFSTWRDVLPTGLPSYLELLIAVGISVTLCGWQTALWAVCMMAVIDWIDDLMDMTADQASGQRNIAHQIGVVETLMLILAALLGAVLISATWTALSFIALTILTIAAELSTTRVFVSNQEGDGVEL